MGYGNAVGDVIFRMCIDCNDAVFCWGFVFGVVVFGVVVVVETWHAASLPDGTGAGTGTEQVQDQEQGQGQGGVWCGG